MCIKQHACIPVGHQKHTFCRVRGALLTCDLVSTELTKLPVAVFQKQICRSAVPPPVANNVGCHGHHDIAWQTKRVLYSLESKLGGLLWKRGSRRWACPLEIYYAQGGFLSGGGLLSRLYSMHVKFQCT